MRWGVGAGASRLVSGTMTIHERLERSLAEFEGTEACVLFGSGYLANVGVLQALGTPGRTIFSDALNHASIIDGCRLARRRRRSSTSTATSTTSAGRLREHGGSGDVIVTDSVFSMDGDVAPLAGIVELARRHGALVVVDEAHATGALGPGGRGAVAEAGLEGEVDVLVGTLSKALGSYGGYACASREIVELLVNRARGADLLDRAVAAGGRRRPGRARAARRAAAPPREAPGAPPRSCAASSPAAGIPVPEGRTQIVPLIVGDADARGPPVRGAARARRVRAGDPPPDGARGQLAPAADRDGLAHRDRADAAPSAPSPRPRGSPAWRSPRRSSRRCRSRKRRSSRPGERVARGCFVTATDTGVGKTILAAALLASLRARGVEVHARKPVADRARRARPEPARRPRAARVADRRAAGDGRAGALRSGGRAALAAELAGRPIDVAGARSRTCAAAGTVIVEGIGGLLVPLAAGWDVRALARELGLGVRRGRATGARHDQPHAAHARGRARRRPRRARRRADALAGRSRRDRALEPRDDRAPRRGRGRDARDAARALARRARARRATRSPTSGGSTDRRRGRAARATPARAARGGAAARGAPVRERPAPRADARQRPRRPAAGAAARGRRRAPRAMPAATARSAMRPSSMRSKRVPSGLISMKPTGRASIAPPPPPP